MLSPSIHEMMLNNLQGEKILLNKSILTSKIDWLTYENLIVSLIKYSQSLPFKKSTLFFAISYMDIIFMNSNNPQNLNMCLVCMASIWVAVKWNEPLSLSSKYTANVVLNHAEGAFNGEELLEMEAFILSSLDFNLIYTTPYNYIEHFYEVFPWFTALKESLPEMIDFAITIPSLAHQAAHEIFYGVFLACCQLKQCVFNHLQEKVFKAQLTDPQVINDISTIIVNEYNKVIQEAMEEEAQQAQYEKQHSSGSFSSTKTAESMEEEESE